jgi:hypothetical protein
LLVAVRSGGEAVELVREGGNDVGDDNWPSGSSVELQSPIRWTGSGLPLDDSGVAGRVSDQYCRVSSIRIVLDSRETE